MKLIGGKGAAANETKYRTNSGFVRGAAKGRR